MERMSAAEFCTGRGKRSTGIGRITTRPRDARLFHYLSNERKRIDGKKRSQQHNRPITWRRITGRAPRSYKNRPAPFHGRVSSTATKPGFWTYSFMFVIVRGLVFNVCFLRFRYACVVLCLIFQLLVQYQRNRLPRKTASEMIRYA